MNPPNFGQNFPLGPMYFPLPTDQLAPPNPFLNHYLENPNPFLMNGVALDNTILHQGLAFPLSNPIQSFGFLPNTRQLTQIPPLMPYYPQYPLHPTSLLPSTSSTLPQVLTDYSFIPPPTLVGQNAGAMNVIGSSIANMKLPIPRLTPRKQKAAEQPVLGEMDNSNQNLGASNDDTSNENNRKRQTKQEKNPAVRTSTYHGVTRYAEDRYEAFVWDNTDRRRKPRTVYIGGYDNEQAAAKAYDLAALKVWGECAVLNFPISNYAKDLVEMQNFTKNEYFQHMRRKSKNFSKGASIYRGVSKNSDSKKWQSRIGKGKDVKGFYLGTFESEEDAARAYDVAAIRLKGENAITNFDINEYDVKAILESPKLPIGKGLSKLWAKTSVDDILDGRNYSNKNIDMPYLHDPNVLVSDLDDPNKVYQLRLKYYLNSQKYPQLHGFQSQANPNGQQFQAPNPPLLQGFNSFNGDQNPMFSTLSCFQDPLEWKGNAEFEAVDTMAELFEQFQTLSAIDEGQGSSLTYSNQIMNNDVITNQNDDLLQANVEDYLMEIDEDDSTTGNLSNSNGAAAEAMVEENPVGVSSAPEDLDKEIASCFEALDELGPLSKLW